MSHQMGCAGGCVWRSDMVAVLGGATTRARAYSAVSRTYDPDEGSEPAIGGSLGTSGPASGTDTGVAITEDDPSETTLRTDGMTCVATASRFPSVRRSAT